MANVKIALMYINTKEQMVPYERQLSIDFIM